MTDRERVLDYEAQITNASNLVDALQLVNWEFTQMQIQDQHLNQIRSAVVGLGDSLEKLLADNT